MTLIVGYNNSGVRTAKGHVMSKVQIVNENGDVRGTITMRDELSLFIEERTSPLGYTSLVLSVPDCILNLFLVTEEQYRAMHDEQPRPHQFRGYHESSLVTAYLCHMTD